ncbi:protein of unknown function DUF129 [Sulfobacillus acidophilus DSM 10332]|uniref:Coenzyme F420:L-glutamate ligase-like domain-containing protein n=1 Tax=Sulfobacillus acidophilus (strain ATCC 700253 / DSM 10332 / NAL) TaxID=679936 RepID=G8TWP9_SULAD|nr:protein of unknown function DUF129 [Sulfobacillus acidophilus DSM 10332]
MSYEQSVADPTVGQWLEKPIREVDGRRYRRYVIRTHLIRPGEKLEKTLLPYLQDLLQPGDMLVLGEKAVAIAEGRAVPLKQVRPRPLARWLSRHVRSLGYGLGLKRPETMEMAFREVGVPRMMVAAALGAVDRVIGRSGDFYRIAGRKVASIDGPGPTTIAPYNQYIVLAPRQADRLVDTLARKFKCTVAVVDVNDMGSEVLAVSSPTEGRVIRQLLMDNPMGQGGQGTPLAVLRPMPENRNHAPWAVPVGLHPAGAVWPFPGGADAPVEWAEDLSE